MLTSFLGLVSMHLWASSGPIEERINQAFPDSIYTALLGSDATFKTSPTDPFQYQVDFAKNLVIVTDKATQKLLYQVRLHEDYPGVINDAEQGVTYVADRYEGFLKAVDSRTGRGIREILLADGLFSPILDKTQNHLFLTAARGSIGPNIFILDAVNFSIIKKTSANYAPKRPVMSPNGKMVVTSHYNGMVSMIATDTLDIRELKVGVWGPSIPVFTQNSRYMFMTLDWGGVAVWDTREEKIVFKNKSKTATFRMESDPVLSPDGQRLFAESWETHSSERYLVVIDVNQLIGA